MTTFKITGLALCAFVIAGSQVLAQELLWQERAPLALPRAGYMAGTIGGKYVIAGGSYWARNQKHWADEVDIFDARANSWTTAAPLPEPRSDAAVVSFQNTLYLFGGGANDHVRRDALMFRGGKWSPVPGAELPEPRLYSVAVVSGGKVYVLGGLSKANDYSTIRNTFWMWNPHAPDKGWAVLSPLPGPGLISHAMAEINGKIYVLGGATSGAGDVANSRASYVFDTQTAKWSKLPDLTLARRCWWGVPIDSRILLVGGFTDHYERQVFSYSPAAHNLTSVGPMPHDICDAKFFRLGDSVVGTGGETADKVRGGWTILAPLSSTRSGR